MELYLGDEPWNCGASLPEIGRDEAPYPMYVAVRCRVDGLPFDTIAMLDTAAPFVMIGGEMAELLDDHLAESCGSRRVLSRFGDLDGTLYRHRLTFLTDDGVGCDLAVEVTLWVCEEWPGELPVVGWIGCLERVRFALEPGLRDGEARFAFGEPS